MAKLKAPKGGVTVRMYRQGHGDCFLLALPREGGGTPVYVLIDCGYKPGSQAFIHKQPIGDIVTHIGEATGYHLDLVIVTHEHQDHVNGIWKRNDPYFSDFEIDEAWFAWTEDPDSELANELRRRHRDQLLKLVEARQKLAVAVGEKDSSVQRVDSLLRLELGSDDDSGAFGGILAAAADPSNSVNKQAMKLIRDKAGDNRGVSYLAPGEGPLVVPGSDSIRAFVLGPPMDADLIADEDPRSGEGFPDEEAEALTFAAAASSGDQGKPPFASRYCISTDHAFIRANNDGFFIDHYGNGSNSIGIDDNESKEILDDAPWRRIDSEWLFSAETLALKLNAGINNTSLVLAFELPASKKVLFFPGDAQRGNWISWADVRWEDGDEEVNARDLLGRTVLYKVSHHCSHNATLFGQEDDDYANLAWMATGKYASEFTAMITAVNEWALTKNTPPWRHPLPSIKAALVKKARGRVFQTDVDEPERPTGIDDRTWERFQENTSCDPLYFDYVIRDSWPNNRH